MNTRIDVTVAIPVVIIFVLLAMLSPFVTIWSLNTLFPSLAIPYDFWTWLATIWINGMVLGRMLRRGSA